MKKPSGRIPTVKQVLKNSQELDYWNNYIAQKVGVTRATSVFGVQSEVGKFNSMYQKDWLDKPINEYCDAMARYINMLGVGNL